MGELTVSPLGVLREAGKKEGGAAKRQKPSIATVASMDIAAFASGSRKKIVALVVAVREKVVIAVNQGQAPRSRLLWFLAEGSNATRLQYFSGSSI